MRIPDSDRYRLVVRSIANAVVAVGVLLLVRFLYRVLHGSITTSGAAGMEPSWGRVALILAFSLPVPLHVISVGLIVQKRWLSPGVARAAWVSVVMSGCWLGVSLAVRLLFYEHP